jgi:hypothetical protein
MKSSEQSRKNFHLRRQQDVTARAWFDGGSIDYGNGLSFMAPSVREKGMS